MKTALIAFLFALLIQIGSEAFAQRVEGVVSSVRTSEAEVRQMPLEKRPNRIGHIYGNNVRRLRQRTLFVNRGQVDRPLARYFYIAR